MRPAACPRSLFLVVSCGLALPAVAQTTSNGAAAPAGAAAAVPVPPVGSSGFVGLGPLFFSEDNSGVLWTLDPTTAAPTNVGASGVTSNTVGLAPRDMSTLYGSTWSTVVIVEANGSGVSPFSMEGVEGLAYDAANDRLFGAINGNFFEIDTTTGIAGAPLAMPGGDVEGIAVGNGGVYGLVGFSGTDTLLYFYDFATGGWASVGDTGIDWNEVGLAYDPGGNELYAKGSQDSFLYRIDPTTAATTPVGDTGLTTGGGLAWLGDGIGATYCDPGVPNSTGASGTITAVGSSDVLDNDVTLRTAELPLQAFGIFLASQQQGSTPQPGGSQGVLCLAGAIGRYVGPGQIQATGTTGGFELVLDLTQTPTPNGLVSIAAGETWNFQAWHRDATMGAATSNFTNAVSVAFQ